MTRLAVSWLGSPSLCAEARALLADAVAARGSVTVVEPELPSELVLRLIVDGGVLTNHGARGYSVAALLYRRVSLLEDLSPEYCGALERDEEVSRYLRALDGAEVPLLITGESGAPLPEKVERIIGRVLDEIERLDRLPVEFALVEEPRFHIDLPLCEDETILRQIAAGEPMDWRCACRAGSPTTWLPARPARKRPRRCANRRDNAFRAAPPPRTSWTRACDGASARSCTRSP
ncbi:MAG: hypothetical protein ACXW4P_13615 [Thermoanaerobaculia bacterium]